MKCLEDWTPVLNDNTLIMIMTTELFLINRFTSYTERYQSAYIAVTLVTDSYSDSKLYSTLSPPHPCGAFQSVALVHANPTKLTFTSCRVLVWHLGDIDKMP